MLRGKYCVAFCPAESTLERPLAMMPGDVCTRTGVFRVMHYQHRVPHDVVVYFGDRFPTCHKCGTRVRFQQILSSDSTNPTIPVEQDLDFIKKIA